MTVGRFPETRMRRNRRDDWTRRLVAENRLSADDLIWPVFVIEGRDGVTDVASMPGVVRVTLDRLAAHVEPAARLGIPAVALFPATPRRPEGCRGDRSRQSGQFDVPGGAPVEARVPRYRYWSATWRSIPIPITAMTA